MSELEARLSRRPLSNSRLQRRARPRDARLTLRGNAGLVMAGGSRGRPAR